MPNPFFEAMVGSSMNARNNAPSKQNLIQMAQQFKQNPLGFLLQKRMNIPSNIAGDPNAILGYLLQSGQIQQSQVDWAKQQLNHMNSSQK